MANTSSLWVAFTSVLAAQAVLLCKPVDASRDPSSPIAQKRAISAKDLVEMRDILALKPSPDGRYVAYLIQQADIEKNDYTWTWYAATIEAGVTPFSLGDGGEIQLARYTDGTHSGTIQSPVFRWSPDGESIVYIKWARDRYDLWRSEIQSGKQYRLISSPHEVTDFEFSSDGKYILFAAGRNHDELPLKMRTQGRMGHLIREPLPNPTHLGIPSPPLCGEFRFELPRDETLSCSKSLWILDLETNQVRPAATHEKKLSSSISGERGQDSDGRLLQSRRSPDKSKLAGIVVADADSTSAWSPIRRVAVLDDPSDQNFRFCPAKECTGQKISFVWWHPDGQEIVFLKRDGDNFSTHSIYGWMPGKDTVREILRTDESLTGSISNTSGDCEMVNNDLICLMAGPTSPARIVAISLQDGNTKTIVDPHTEFENFVFTKVEKLSWDDGFGGVVVSHLVYPPDYQADTKYPLVVVTYRSRGFLRGGVGDENPIHAIAQNGMFVLSFDMPSDQSLFETIDDPIQLQIERLKDFKDNRRQLRALESVMDYLADKGLIDNNRVGISGLSTGAAIVAQAISTTDRFAVATAAAAANVGALSYYFSPSWNRNVLREVFGEDLEGYRKIFSAADVDAPLLLQVPDSEYLYSLQSYIDLSDAIKPVEMWVFADEYHVKWQPAHRYNVYRRNLQWFKFWLTDEEADDPVDPDQYGRWRKMRDDHCASLNAEGQDSLPVYCKAA